MPFSKPPKSKRMNRKKNLVPLSPVHPFRLKLVFFIFFLGLTGLLGRISWLQVFQSDLLEARARAVQTEKKRPLGTRRSILDRKGRLVALDEEKFRLWAHPRYFNFPGDSPSEVRTTKEVAMKIADILAIKDTRIISLIGGQSSGIKLAEGLDPEVAAEIKELRISGLDLEAYAERTHPQE